MEEFLRSNSISFLTEHSSDASNIYPCIFGFMDREIRSMKGVITSARGVLPPTQPAFLLSFRLTPK